MLCSAYSSVSATTGFGAPDTSFVPRLQDLCGGHIHDSPVQPLMLFTHCVCPFASWSVRPLASAFVAGCIVHQSFPSADIETTDTLSSNEWLNCRRVLNRNRQEARAACYGTKRRDSRNAPDIISIQCSFAGFFFLFAHSINFLTLNDNIDCWSQTRLWCMRACVFVYKRWLIPHDIIETS